MPYHRRYGSARHPAPALQLAAALLLMLSIGLTPQSGIAKSINHINGIDEFQQIISGNQERLLMIEFYADWCSPCRLLDPVVSEIAREYRDRLAVYKVNVDNNRSLARAIGIRGIPYVAFYQDGRKTSELMGLHPKYRYERVIKELASPPEVLDVADGHLANGVRMISRPAGAAIDSIYVYRGETVRLEIGPSPLPFSVHVPDFGINRDNRIGKPLNVTFTAEAVGVFPIYCNGSCPDGDSMKTGSIIVMAQRSANGVDYSDLNAKQAKALIDSTPVLVLDVRTPMEYRREHIDGSRPIPLQQLADRIGEIEAFRNHNILIYCRSGSRSAVAAEILHRAGFKRLFNLKDGIIGWRQAGYSVISPSGY